MAETPEDLLYTRDHEWLRSDGDLITVGVTDFAQESLGDIVFVQLPDVGTALQAGTALGEIESTKSVSDVYAPISGEVVERNEALDATPEAVNSSPYADGWLVKLRPATPLEPTSFLSATDYAQLIAEGT